ncbi:MAG: Asp-tRNA(Asn)/Glu-tRNA(Gln) amidotransferase subunit GatB [Gammaproteobacteria bacterium]|nr:Asp-tRNA(Asn)/Glu-tRNA(Gln) amidotransferase subunit GatB [Gammaproteobacteria bacterium]MDE0257363.1 Asp-tRNA(Asn)/Glu-tRNA(Gln) amidotransferase subunit GatB [Gammaproteobacteria bacterium]
MKDSRLEAVIGLEVHVQLDTGRKLFCADSTAFGAPPNTAVCPVCLGLPGALPVLDPGAVDLALRAALALDCTIHPVSVFARKNYFYPDLPKGYQISQFERPLATRGAVELDGGRRVRIRRVHMEEDAGKSLHDRFASATAIDLNRTGTPLIEVVSEPDLRSPREARSYLQLLKRLMEYLGISDCNMEEGSLRVDANVSLRKKGSERLEASTEVKNLNSFSAVEKALGVEIWRQTRLRAEGRAVTRQTLLWDAAGGDVRVMRDKEDSQDYRYFPDPDLPPLVLSAARVASLRAELGELPRAKRERFRRQYELPAYDADVLTSSRGLADYYEAVVACGRQPKTVSNWVMGPVLETVKRGIADLSSPGLAPGRLAELLVLVDKGTLSATAAKTVLAGMARTGDAPGAVVQREGLRQVREDQVLDRWVTDAVTAHPEAVARYRAGETRLFGFLMGQVMRASGRKADPRRVSQLLRAALDADAD